MRIEDTDQTRFDPAALEDIFETFRWMGIDFDEGPHRLAACGPYIQSHRSGLYSEYAQSLLDAGHAYKCFCSPERLARLRDEQQKANAQRTATQRTAAHKTAAHKTAAHKTAAQRTATQRTQKVGAQKAPAQKTGAQGYDRHCRELSREDWARQESAGKKAVIRFKVPREAGLLEMEDGVVGGVTWDHEDISPDPILLKTDGLPTYHLASVVDDHLMNISHVIRAQEWLSSTALHHLLYTAFDWKPPQFLHLPMVLGPDGKKLSKRHGSTSVLEFRREGYLPEAVLNYVMTLGWSLGDEELFSKENLAKVFAQGNINKAPAIFDYKKLLWYNAHYIREADDERLVNDCRPYFHAQTSGAHAQTSGADAKMKLPEQEIEKIVLRVMPLAKQRMKKLSDIFAVVGFLYTDVSIRNVSELLQKNQDETEALAVCKECLQHVEELAAMDDKAVHDYFEEYAQRQGIGLGRVMMPLRMALTGSKASLPLAVCIRLLGPRTTHDRLSAAILLLEGQA